MLQNSSSSMSSFKDIRLASLFAGQDYGTDRGL
jgi:hypothetical protein